MPKISMEHCIPSADYLLPDVAFVLDTEPSELVTFLKEAIPAFIRENFELVPTSPISNSDQYARGFRDALAIVNLWIETDLERSLIDGSNYELLPGV